MANLSGFFLEEVKVGDKWITPSRTITETDVILFAGLTSDNNPLHTDEHWCQQNSQFGTRIAHGMLVSSIALGLWCRMGLGDGSAIAAMGCDWRYVAAVKIGDTIHMEVEIAELKQSKSKPQQGVQILNFTVINQDGAVVQRGRFDAMKKWYRPVE